MREFVQTPHLAMREFVQIPSKAMREFVQNYADNIFYSLDIVVDHAVFRSNALIAQR